jgi:hypothetical protein
MANIHIKYLSTIYSHNDRYIAKRAMRVNQDAMMQTSPQPYIQWNIDWSTTSKPVTKRRMYLLVTIYF